MSCPDKSLQVLPFSGDAAAWNRIVASLPGTAPEQSWEWAAAGEEFGWQTERLLFQREGQVLGAASVQLRKKWGQSTCLISRGPLLDYSNLETLLAVLSALKNYYRHAIFIKINPRIEASPEILDAFNASSYTPSPDLDLYKETLEIDLAKSEEELYRKMRAQFRNGINTERKRIEVRSCTASEFLPDFKTLHRRLCAEKHLSGVPLNYFERFAKHLEPAGILLMRGAFQDGILRSGILLLKWHSSLLFKWGATDRSPGTSAYASQVLHWDTMLWAKSAGLRYYDLGGFDEQHSPGVAQFKRGFGGTLKKFVGEFDSVNKPMIYSFYRMLH